MKMGGMLIEDIGRLRTDIKKKTGYTYPIVYYVFNIVSILFAIVH